MRRARIYYLLFSRNDFQEKMIIVLFPRVLIWIVGIIIREINMQNLSIHLYHVLENTICMIRESRIQK